ncbi:MAG: GntR family transcriptional regulator [Lachnospiraceae bacterium]
MEPLKILPKKPKENNRAYAYRLLRYNIMTLNLAPGLALNENEIADLLGTSRTPIHEALTLLQKDYLVDILPQSGSFVSKISMRNVREGLFMRSTLEPAIYRQLAGNISEKYMKAMAGNLEQTVQTVVSGDDSVDRYIALDDEFHKLAYLAAHKPAVWESTRIVCSHFQRVRYQEYLVMQIDVTHIQREHQQLYEYLLFGGSPYFNLEEFYNKHLSYYKSYISELIAAHPEYYIMD